MSLHSCTWSGRYNTKSFDLFRMCINSSQKWTHLVQMDSCPWSCGPLPCLHLSNRRCEFIDLTVMASAHTFLNFLVNSGPPHIHSSTLLGYDHSWFPQNTILIDRELILHGWERLLNFGSSCSSQPCLTYWKMGAGEGSFWVQLQIWPTVTGEPDVPSIVPIPRVPEPELVL